MAISPLSVLLGVPDAECKEKGTWSVNKIGGLPDWMNCAENKEHVHPSCQLCSNPLHMVVQIYCPLSGSPYHRTLYVFACVKKACQENERSWSVLRMQKLEEKSKTNDTLDKLETTGNVTDWTEDADDWGSDDGDGDEDEDFLEDTETELKSISEPQGEISSGSLNEGSMCISSLTDLKDLSLSDVTGSGTTANHMRRFVPHYINVFTEPDQDVMDSGDREQRLLSEYAEREGFSLATSWDLALSTPSGEDKSSGEDYEKTLPSHGNVVFSKFTKKLRRCPEQCLRYCWSGKPLLISNLPGGFAPPVCQFCGAQRIFELQLMSPLISSLHSSDLQDASLDFGTILIYTCSQSCWENEGTVLRVECAILQKDPDHDIIGHL